MKKLKLKIQDLENPSILTHREIKNILGGGDDWGSGYWDHYCDVWFWGAPDEPTRYGYYGELEMQMAQALFEIDPSVRQVSCS